MLHLGQADGSSARARRYLHPWALLGRSTHAPRQIDKAIKDRNVDYFCVGPVYATSTKPDYEPVGLDLVRYAAQKSASRRDQVEAVVRHWRDLAGQHRRCDRGRGAAGLRRAGRSPRPQIRRKQPIGSVADFAPPGRLIRRWSGMCSRHCRHPPHQGDQLELAHGDQPVSNDTRTPAARRRRPGRSGRRDPPR